MNVLIVDDDDFALDVLENALSRMGHTVTAARDGREAMDVLRRGAVRVVVTDWDMPEMNGVELCRALRREDLAGYVYVVMLTGREGAKQRLEGLCAGADAFLNKPLDPEELLVCLKSAERILSLETRDVALFAMAKLAESRDPLAGAHVERVQSYSRLIAKHLSPEMRACHGVDEEFVQLLYQTSPLHDLGKVGIPDAILLKPGRLTPEEIAVMRTHATLGAETLDAALRRFPSARFLQIARDIAATHHEKFDGSGYPAGLAGDQIPLCGRIVAVADVYDALTSRRVYKAAGTHAQAMATIAAERGRHFDPDVVDAFVRAEEQITLVRENLRDGPAPAESTAPALAAPALPVPPPRGPCGPNPCKILLAEDDPFWLAKLTELLAATGEPVFAVGDGEEALRVMEEHGPRLVVSDWVMPKMDGVELCRRIRERGDAEPIRFIMLTAHSDKARLLDAYRAGVDDFVSKPFDPEELLARVRAGIRAAKVHDDLHRRAAGSQALNGRLATDNSRLERMSMTDELTGLSNRRHAMTRMEEQWAASAQSGRPLTIATIDIDYFKQINDTHGHDAGDLVLQKVAALLRDKTRGSDTVCRLGGDEFLIIFPAQTTQEAQICAERFRAAVEAHRFEVGGGRTLSTSVSIGLATRVRGMAQLGDLFKAADDALYAAKRGGRRAVRTFESIGATPAPVPADPVDGAVAVPRPPVDLQAATQRCGGDSSFAATVLARFESMAGGEVAKVERALAAGDAAGVHRGAHSLKSMSAYVAADAASELAREVEGLAHAGRLADVAAPLAKLRAEVDRAAAWIGSHRPATEVARVA